MAIVPNISAAPSLGYANLMQREQTAAALQAAGASSKKSSGLLSDGIMKELLQEGMPNDVDFVLNKLYKLEATDYSRGIGSQKKDMYEAYSYIGRALTEGKHMKKTEEKVFSNNSLDSIAVDDKGNVFTFDGKNLDKIPLSKLNPEKNRALTVGDLIYLRKENPKLVFDNTLFQVLANVPGQQQIQDHISNLIDKIGSASDSKEAYQNIYSLIEGRSARPTQQEFKALQELYNIVVNEGIESALFKVKNSTESKNLQQGLNYLLNVLPNKHVNQLRAQYVVNYGGKYSNSNEYVVDMLATALNAKNTIKSTYSEDYDSNINKALDTDAAENASTQDKNKTRSMTTMENFFNQSLNWVTEGIKISFPGYGNKLAFNLQGTKIPALALDDGSATTGKGPLSVLLDSNGKGMGKFLDMSKSFVGTDKVYPQLLNNIYYSNAEVANVWMPIKPNGDIDWESMQAFSAAEKEIKEKKITDIREKNNIHYKHNSSAVYDPVTGEYRNEKVAQFLYTNGYTIDDSLSDDNNMFREVTGDESDLVSKEMDAVYESFKSEVSGKNFWDDIVEVPVFIKIKDNSNINSSYYGRHGSQVPKTTINEDRVMQEINKPSSQPIYSSASLLYQE